MIIGAAAISTRGKRGSSGPIITSVNTSEFTGASSQYLTVPNDSSLVPSGDFTMSAWVHLDIINDYQYALVKYNSTGNNRSFILGVLNTNVAQIWYSYDGTGSNRYFCNGTTALSINTWYMITAIKSGTDLKIYINGVEDGTTTTGGENLFGGTDDLYVGGQGSTNQYRVDGSIANTMIIDKAISLAELSELYNSGVIKDPDNYSSSITSSYLFALPMNTGVSSGTEYDDRSSFGNDPTGFAGVTLTGELIEYEE